MVAVQSTGAAPLVHAVEHGLDHVEFLSEVFSRALSIADPITGEIALRVIQESSGDAIAVSDETIMETGRLLARYGLVVEPSSAASVAGALTLLECEPERRDQTNVCIITSSGLKWLDDYDVQPLPGGIFVDSVEEAVRVVKDEVGE